MITHDIKMCFIRHGESYKNIHGIHGGKGQCLTEKGLQECNDVVSKIQSVDFDNTNSILVGNNSQQVIETMNIFASKFNCPSKIDDRIQGLYLGVANGVSREDLKMQYPKDAVMLEQWRAKKISISELEVTGMEDVNDFHSRIIDFIRSCKNSQNTNTFFVVCTTSIMIMIINLIALGESFNYESYYHYAVKTGDYIFLNVKENLRLELIETNIEM